MSRPKIPGVPCLLDIQEPSVIQLSEISPSLPPVKGDAGKWLLLYLRELLGMKTPFSPDLTYSNFPVDIQFVTRHQTLNVKFQGRTRTFKVHSASYTGQPSSKIEFQLDSLSLDPQSNLLKHSAWSVRWDTVVDLVTLPQTSSHNVGSTVS